MASFKTSKRYLSNSDTESDFPRFIIIESLQDVKLDQLSPFLIEKIISSRSNPKTVKKVQTGNLLVEVESKKHAENLLKTEKFHHLKCLAYPHAKSHTSNGIVRSKELSLAALEEIETTFKEQGIKEYRRVTIRRNDETIQTHTYILTFEKPSIPKEIRIGFTRERVEQYIQAPLRCFKYQKFGHYKEIFRGRQVCDKCGGHDPNHMENECKNIKCANCHEEHPAFSRSCAIYKKEKEIMFIKHTKNIPFLEAKKIIESYMGTITYANVAQKVNQPPQDSTSIDKYQKLIEKLINLKAYELLTFQENLKRMCSSLV